MAVARKVKKDQGIYTTLANRRHNTVFSPYFTCLLVPVFPLFAPPTTLANRRDNTVFSPYFTCLLVPVFPLFARHQVVCAVHFAALWHLHTSPVCLFSPVFFSTRPMSSSSDEDDDGYSIIKAHYFRRRSFWTWAKGADFLTIPFTGTKICCVEEENWRMWMCHVGSAWRCGKDQG